MSSKSHYSSTQPPRKRRKRVKMIARITSYDYNVQFDMRQKSQARNSRGATEGLYAAPIHEESYNVMEGEILMAKEQAKHYRDGQLHCFSFANCLGAGLPAALQTQLMSSDDTKAKAARKLARFMILDNLTYVGVAVTGFDARSNSYQDMSQGFVATFGGMNTITNTGRDEIRPGDWITVDIPDQLKWDDDPFNRYKKAEGIPLDKLLFATVPYKVSSSYKVANEILGAIDSLDDTNANVQAAMRNRNVVPSALQALQKSDGSFPADLTNAAAAGGGFGGQEGAFKAVMAVDQQRKRLIIGKALSYARPGEPFDIVLGGQPSF